MTGIINDRRENMGKKITKEAEGEAESVLETKKPTEEVDGKLVKESESMVEDDEDLSDMDETEKASYRKLRLKVKKRAIKSADALNPAESEDKGNTAGSTTTPNAGVPSGKQDVFVPSSSVDGQRTQDTPMDSASVSKSVSPDLVKSPLYTGLSSQIEELKKAMDSKLSAVEKSYNDRLDNMKKSLEQFYSGSFYKAAAIESAPEANSFEKQLEKGEIRFRNK
jgi:hypothetical protein